MDAKIAKNKENAAKVNALKGNKSNKTKAQQATEEAIAEMPTPPKLHGCEAVLETIWPIRFKKRRPDDTGELYIKTTLRNLFLYIIFLTVLCISE